ncbi:MAG: protein-tyrosine-phosphatase [Bacteroidia bacterium]
MIYSDIKNYCDNLVQHFNEIPSERKTLLTKIAEYIKQKKQTNQPVQLIYVCTHNSRRSHLGQIWAAVAANYFHINNVKTFSGGTEATAFNINAINTLKKAGFKISANDVQTSNPIYTVRFGDAENESTTCFSKVYDDAANPKSNFAAIMTCSDAEQNCPFIPGVELRIGTTYNDPKEFDNTPLQEAKYEERSRQIAMECLYVFSLV